MNKRITVKFFGCLNALKFRRHEGMTLYEESRAL